MIDLFQGMDSAQLAQLMYQHNPNLDPTPLLGKLDSFAPPSQAAYNTSMANAAASMPGGDYMSQLTYANAGPGAAGLGAGQWAGLLQSGQGMLNRARPQPVQLPEPPGPFPGGPQAKFLLGMPGPTVRNTPSLRELFARLG